MIVTGGPGSSPRARMLLVTGRGMTLIGGGHGAIVKQWQLDFSAASTK
jgi:hypothetical protein